MKEFVLHPEAYRDIQEIWEYIAADNLTAADRIGHRSSISCSTVIPASLRIVRRVPTRKFRWFGTTTRANGDSRRRTMWLPCLRWNTKPILERILTRSLPERSVGSFVIDRERLLQRKRARLQQECFPRQLVRPPNKPRWLPQYSSALPAAYRPETRIREEREPWRRTRHLLPFAELRCSA